MIELIVLDVDGCLSDSKITYSENKLELKSFNVKDGLGITTWKKMGKKVAIITGRKSQIVEKRAAELGVDYLFQNEKQKDLRVEEILQKENLKWQNIAAIGDDFNDLKLLLKVELSFCPEDANSKIKEKVDVVLQKKGGEGAVREMIDLIVQRDNLDKKWNEIWL